MKRLNFKKKYLAGALAAGLIMGAGGLAAAFFGVSGSGSATAKTGHATDVKIESVGAGYDSLLAPSTPDPYSGSLCFVACDQNSEIGDAVSMTTATSYVQLTSVTVALVNFGTAKALSVTLHLTGGPNGNYTFTKTQTIAAGTSATQKVTNVTFTLVTKGVFVWSTSTKFHYGVSLTSNTSGVNIALAKRTQLTIGSSPTHEVWLDHAGGGFKATTVTWTTATNFVPAVEFNMVGGRVGPLYPGAPAMPVAYAVTNPGATGAHLTTVSTALGTLPTGCQSTWFAIYGTQPHTVDRTFPPGLTVVTNTGTTIAMLTKPVTQDSCANAAIPLTFTGTP